MIDYNHAGVPTTVDSLRVATSSKAPSLYIRKSVTRNIPISGYLTFRYIRGLIDYLVVDYKVPGDGTMILNITIDDLLRMITSKELPGLDYVDPDKNETVYNILISEMDEMGFMYIPLEPRFAY